MDFIFTEDQRTITEAAREMLVENATPAAYRSMLERGEARDADRWAMIRDMGLLSMLAPEDKGGLGMTIVDLVGIAEAAGYVALPEPLIEQAGIIVPLLARVDDDRGWLDKLLDGANIAVGHPVNSFVENADHADALILSDGDMLHIVNRADVTLTEQKSIDQLRRLYSVEWSPSNATALGAGWGDTLERGAILAAAQLVGLGQRCIDMSVAYTTERQQFGKPIGSYQAVKHMLADPSVRIEFARPVVHAAAAEMDIGNLAAQARAAHAKIAAGAAADLAARNAVQAHGAMGMTWEVDLHFFFKRALALNYAWGSPAVHAKRIAERMANLPLGPDASFASELNS